MLKRIIYSIVTLVVLVGLIIFGVNHYQKEKREEILSQKDLRLVSFELAKVHVNKVKDLISIDSNEEYLENKEQFKKNMTDDLHEEYFPTKNYEGGKKYFTIKENSISGEMVNSTEFIFKVDLSLVEENTETPLILLVYIKDNIIYKIQSLG